MSTADDAWQAYLESDAYLDREDYNDRATFMAGYRRALEDVAHAVKQARETGVITGHTGYPTHPYMENWLRDRAAGVGTKDGDDERPEFDSPNMWEEGR